MHSMQLRRQKPRAAKEERIYYIKPILNWANVSSRTELEVFVEAIFGVQKASLNMFWEHSPYSTIIAIGWEQSSPVDEEKIK